MRFFKSKEKPTKEAKSVGQVFIATDTGNVVPESVFQSFSKYTSQGDTTLVIPERVQAYETEWARKRNLAAPPYPPESFLTLYESNPILNRTIKQVGIDVAGSGWDLIPVDGETERPSDKAKIEALLNKPNPEMGLEDIFERILTDWGYLGYLGIEAVRNLGGEIIELHHIPAKDLWVHKKKELYCQKKGQKEAWFKKFGSDTKVNAATGDPADGIDIKEAANELIFYKNYYPRSDYYGVPNFLPAVGSLLSLIGIRDYNLSFFQSYGIPAYAVTMTGEWDEKAAKKIKEHLTSGVLQKGKGQAPIVSISSEDGAKIEFQKLSVDVKDGSFRVYSQLLRDEVLACYSMPPYRIGINVVGSLGGTNIQESTVIYNQAVVEPLQNRIERIINQLIIRQGLQVEAYNFKLKNMDTRNEDAEATRDQGWIQSGVKTPNQIRQDRGLEGYDGGNQYYIASNLIPVGEDDVDRG